MDQELRRALEVLARHVGDDSGPQVTVRELWDEWAPEAERTRKDWHVKRSHRSGLLDREVQIGSRRVCLGDLNWHECDVVAADAWRAVRTDLAPGTRNCMLGTLRGMFKFHLARKRIPRHPLRGARIEPERRRVGYFTEETIDRFAGTMNALCSLIMRLAFATGMRSSEIRELRRHEVDRRERLIVIPGWRSKNGLPKWIPVPDDIWPEFEGHLDRQLGEFVFPAPRDPRRPIGKTSLRYWIVKARESTGMVMPGGEAPTLHHTRHGWAVRFMAEGGNMAAAMAIMGHTSVQSTRIYQRPVGPALEKTRELMTRRGPKGAIPAGGYQTRTRVVTKIG